MLGGWDIRLFLVKLPSITTFQLPSIVSFHLNPRTPDPLNPLRIINESGDNPKINTRIPMISDLCNPVGYPLDKQQPV